jgi:hypothetical protein
MKQTMSIMLYGLLVLGGMNTSMRANEHNNGILQLSTLSDAACKNVIKQLYAQAVADAFDAQLPEDFKNSQGLG